MAQILEFRLRKVAQEKDELKALSIMCFLASFGLTLVVWGFLGLLLLAMQVLKWTL